MQERKRAFNFHWGSGYVAEEAQIQGPHHSPTFQLLRYTDGEAAERVSIRFCYYSHSGRFQRSPLMMSEEEIDLMREALKETHELRDLLVRLVGE